MWLGEEGGGSLNGQSGTPGKALLKGLNFTLKARGSYYGISHRGETRSEFHCRNRSLWQ